MKKHALISLLATSATAALATAAFAEDGAEIVNSTCTACHAQADDGHIDRIDDGRRTPEGWDMTVVRMMRNHGVELSDEERIAVVRHLSDTRGLSIAETEAYRYILEKEPLSFDAGPSEMMTQMCGRCHSYARVALQYRTREDWEKMIHFHLGQYPSLEYQALARDRDWWGIAQTEVLDYLAENYPLGEMVPATDVDASGEWAVAGHMHGHGDYSGSMTIAKGGAEYTVAMDLTFADGSNQKLTGQAVLIGAGEWRASLSNGTDSYRQVMALNADGGMTGRWFLTESDVIGARINAARTDAAPVLLGVAGDHIRAGESATVTLTGTGLEGTPGLSDGLSAEIVSATPNRMELKVTAAADAAPGKASITVGDLSADIVVYNALDRVSILPEQTFSRMGGAGGLVAKVPAQFEAIGWLNGPDGEPGTEDDIRVGVFDAKWSFGNFDELAELKEDAKFAGSIDDNGLFTPADAGPNPDRQMNGSNAGNLSVTAVVEDGGQTLEGKAQLYATVQRFIDWPIH